MLEEMVRARDFVVMDGDALLRAQFVDQFLDRARRHDFVLSARDDDARRGRSEEHTSELQSLMRISYAVFCLKKKIKTETYARHKTKYVTDILTLNSTHNIQEDIERTET